MLLELCGRAVAQAAVRPYLVVVLATGLDDIRAALAWLNDVGGGDSAFLARLNFRQESYRDFTGQPEHRGKDPKFWEFCPDTAASYFAHAKSLLDDRRSFDQKLAAECLPWMKQLGWHVKLLDGIAGRRRPRSAAKRAARCQN